MVFLTKNNPKKLKTNYYYLSSLYPSRLYNPPVSVVVRRVLYSSAKVYHNIFTYHFKFLHGIALLNKFDLPANIEEIFEATAII